MSKTVDDICRKEYSGFRAKLISEWRIGADFLSRFDEKLKPIHRRYISFACAAAVVSDKTKRNEYAKGAIEAGYLSLAMAIKGLENPACVLLRQCVELVLKHIYFSSHPIEYSWVRLRDDYREQSFQYLIDYLSRTSECKEIGLSPNPCERLNVWYGILSRHVHVHSMGFMGYMSVSSGRRLDISVIKRLDERSKEVWPLLTILFIIYAPNRYFRASEIEKRLIRMTVPRGIRTRLDLYLRRLV
jgi:hypothetical protein